jgi:hypothetical protein
MSITMDVNTLTAVKTVCGAVIALGFCAFGAFVIWQLARSLCNRGTP